MNNVSHQFNEQYVPVKALLIYNSVVQDTDNYERKETEIYVESYDIGKYGNPINAHPLSIKEMDALSQLFQSSTELKNTCLHCKGIIPQRVIHINAQSNGYAIWYTPPKEVNLFFTDNLSIPSGRTKIPALLWKATKDRLQVFSLKGKAKPNINTPLYYAPLFNLSSDGSVCMGTVNINIDRQTYLEYFISQWETYFFNSYFTHTIGSHKHCKGNLVQLWQEQISTGRDFPQSELIKNGKTLKDIIK
jgi:PRTRC genetic system protein B